MEHFQPKVFIIENVLGLRSAAGGRYFTAVQHEARILGKDRGRPGYRVHAQIDKSTFKDRYTRQHRNRPCSTIVAHLSKDGLMFIHPVQNRSLTPREAARVQAFPDWFVFPNARTHAFRIIGNAVPPLVAEAAGDAVRTFLNVLARPHRYARRRGRFIASVPSSAAEAASRLNALMSCDRRHLRELNRAKFLAGWHALLWLFPGLHPDNALDHGPEKIDWPEAESVLPDIELSRRQVHVRSGWRRTKPEPFDFDRQSILASNF